MNQFKLSATVAAVAGVALFGLAAGAKADSTDDLLKALRDKGILNEQEFDNFNATRDTEKVKKLSEIKASFKDGIVWESGDKQNSLKVGGRVHFDYHNINTQNGGTANLQNNSDWDSASLADNFEIRRARIDLQGKFYNDYTFQIETNLVGSSPNLINQAWVNIGWWEPVQFRFGRYKEPFNLEKMTSSNNIDFNERSWVNSVAPNEVLGAMVWGEPTKGLIYQANVFQKNFNEVDTASNDMFAGGRIAANFAQFAGWNDTVVHVGVSGYDGTWGVRPQSTLEDKSDSKTRGTVFQLGTEGRGLDKLFRAQIAGNTTLTLANGQNASSDAVVDQKALGLEFAAAKGPVKFQSEWTRASIDATFQCSPYDGNTSSCNTDAKSSPTKTSIGGDVKIWYAELLWLVTGESYADSYKSGAWGAIKPKNDFVHPSLIANGGGLGAWELGLRYSNFDASDLAHGIRNANGSEAGFNADGTAKEGSSVGALGTRVQGYDKAHSYTGGIKWILNPNIRFLADYTYTKFEGNVLNDTFPIDLAKWKASAGGIAGVTAIDHENAFTIRGQINF